VIDSSGFPIEAFGNDRLLEVWESLLRRKLRGIGRPKEIKKAMKLPIIRLALSAMLLALSFPAEAQQPKKVPRIGYLSPFDPATESTRAEAIRLALRELGYIEGQNIASEYRYAAGKLDRYPELAAELVRLKVDIILVTGGDRVTQAAKNATKTIPIVMTGPGVRSCRGRPG